MLPADFDYGDRFSSLVGDGAGLYAPYVGNLVCEDLRAQRAYDHTIPKIIHDYRR